MEPNNSIRTIGGNTASSPIPGTITQMFRILNDLQDERRKAELQAALQKLSDKYYDPELRLAVIGNFSCGKSTFLNAVLGRELLSISDLPTTAIPTYIRWNRSKIQERLDQMPPIEEPGKTGSKTGIFDHLKAFFCDLLLFLLGVILRIFPQDKAPEFLTRAIDRLYMSRSAQDAPQEEEEPPDPSGDPDDPYITVITCQGKTYILHGNGLKRFERDTGLSLPRETGPLIDYLTTTNTLANTVARIELSFPEQECYRNFCLIDTPGVNPGDEGSKNHILQTQSVLREEADAAIILYPAKDAMSKDLERFMEEHAAHLLSDAIVLITKIDIVTREREREKVLSNTRRLVQKRFGQEEPVIYGISAGRSLEHKVHGQEESGEDDGMWDRQFEEALGEIFHSLRERRETIISKRISAMLTELMDAVCSSIQQDTESMIQEREKIRNYSLENLMMEISKLYEDYERKLHNESQARRSEVRSIVRNCVQARCSQICSRLQEQTNSSDLKQCMENDAKEILNGVDQEIVQQINRKVIAALDSLSSRYAADVEKCLEVYQRHIGQVGRYEAQMTQNDLTSTSGMSMPDAPSFLGNNAAALGLAGGALLLMPQFALPALAVGWLIDKFRFDSRKAEAIDKMIDQLNDYGESLASEFEKNMERTEEEDLNWAKHILENYKARYKTYFDKVEQDLRQREERINQTISLNQRNMDRMAKLQAAL